MQYHCVHRQLRPAAAAGNKCQSSTQSVADVSDTLTMAMMMMLRANAGINISAAEVNDGVHFFVVAADS